MNRQRYALMIAGMFTPILILSLFLNGYTATGSPLLQPVVAATVTSPSMATTQPQAPARALPQPALPTPTVVGVQGNPSLLTRNDSGQYQDSRPSTNPQS